MVIRSFSSSVSRIRGEVIVEGNTRGLNGHPQSGYSVCKLKRCFRLLCVNAVIKCPVMLK